MIADKNIDINNPRLPLAALTAASFALGTGAYVFAGHLEALVRDRDAGRQADAAVLLALNGSTVLVGQGLGAALGALTTATFGLGALGFAASAVAAVGLTASFALSPPRGAELRPRAAQPTRDMAS